jgi:hypothetical protein
MTSRFETTVILPRALSRSRIIERIAAVLTALPLQTAWRIEVHEHKSTRTPAQNAYLWGVVYPTILEAGELKGWEPDDLHEYLLGEHFGWEIIEGLGKRRMRPIRRSSKLDKQEFSDYIDFIQRKMAQFGIFIPDANGEVAP